MRYYSKLNVYKASNVLFNPTDTTALSYGWWLFVKKIKGKTVFNNYNYSPTTIKHQYKTRRLLESLGIPIDATIEAPQGLQAIESAIPYYESKIAELQAQIAKPRSQLAKNIERMNTIKTYETQIKLAKQLAK